MTARSVRAVRAAPGATSDRRDCLQAASISPVTPAEITSGERPRRKFAGPDIQEATNLLKEAGSAPWRSAPASPQKSCSLPPSLSEGRPRIRRENPLEIFRVIQDLACKLDSHRGTLELLALLYIVGPCTIYEMRKNLRVRQRALYGSLGTLLDLKWVQHERLHEFPRARTKTYRMSVRGEAMIEPIMEAWLHFLREQDHI